MISQGPDEAAKSAEEEWRNDILVEKAVLRKVTFEKWCLISRFIIEGFNCLVGLLISVFILG